MKHFVFSLFLFLSYGASAQDSISLIDLSFWQANAEKNWQIAGDVSVDPDKDDAMTLVKGAGILANLPDQKNRSNLLSRKEYGDVDVSFDFIMAKHSNSGFYLQGRYELQLLDSWGQQFPGFGDCGGVYARRRWAPEEQLFDGHAPRQNACLAPGLWQHLEISFQAPRFDITGKKTANARLLKVMLNGVTIHENLELSGPTGGPISELETAKGPFMIQGDHGPVAFRHFIVSDKSGEAVKNDPFTYKLISSGITYPMDFSARKIDRTGACDRISWELAGKEDAYGLLFNGRIHCASSGKHHIVFQTGGMSSLKIDGKTLLPEQWTYSADPRSADIMLAAGAHDLEIATYKSEGWMPPFLGLWIEGPDSRATALHSGGSTLGLQASDPIRLDARTPVVFRSFMDVDLPNTQRNGPDLLNLKDPKRKRIVHAVQVGDPTHLHYTYDLDNGALAQIWKGEFLNTSPMWDDRGDGSSRPLGAVLVFDDILTVVPKDRLFDLTTSANNPVLGFSPHGYDLDESGRPLFRYALNGIEFQDQLKVQEGKSLSRTLLAGNLEKGGAQVVRLAVGKKIEKTDEHTWIVDNKRFYVRIPDEIKAAVESSGGISVLYVPLSSKVEWTLMW